MAKRLPGLTVATGLVQHPFDVKYGVRTSGLVAGRHLKTGHRHDRQTTAYFGVAPSVFVGLMRRWMRSLRAAPLEDFTFIDIGAGMGRAVLLASGMSFHRVVGVELNPILARTARRNAALWRQAGYARAPIRISEKDAVEIKFPSGPCVIFLFNPFGAVVMRRFLAGLRRQLTGRGNRAHILYVNNEQEQEIEQSPGWERVFRGRVRRSREDIFADRKILESHPDGEYAAANYEDCSIWRRTDSIC